MSTSIRRLLTLTLIIMLALISALPSRPTSADVRGATYTSPTYGYTVTWPATWFFIEEAVDPGVDYLWISDGMSSAQFLGGPILGTPSVELAGMIMGFGSSPEASNFAPLLDDQGSMIRFSDDTQAYAIYSFTADLGGGSTMDAVIYLGIVSIGAGLSVGVIINSTRDAFDATSQFSSVLSAITLNGTPLPQPGGIAATPDERVPTAPELPGAGSLAPEIASAQWRMALTAVSIGTAIPGMELEAKADQEWLAIVADVTNWSDFDGTFDLGEPRIQTAGLAEPEGIAPSSTRQVARLLGLTEQGNRSVDIAAGDTARAVLVYAIPASETGIQLLLGDAVIALDDHLDVAFDPTTLPSTPDPPRVIEGIITNVSVNSAGTLTLSIEGSSEEYALIGADLPSGSDCYASASLVLFVELIGSQVMIEFEPAVESTTQVYVWLVGTDGARTLLNHQLIATGAARLSMLPNESRFAGWLLSAETAAQAAGTGLWGECGS
jgi:hypothetical protein